MFKPAARREHGYTRALAPGCAKPPRRHRPRSIVHEQTIVNNRATQRQPGARRVGSHPHCPCPTSFCIYTIHHHLQLFACGAAHLHQLDTPRRLCLDCIWLMTLGQRLGVDRREQHPDPAARDDDQGGLLKTALTYGAIHPEAINGGHRQKAGCMEGASVVLALRLHQI